MKSTIFAARYVSGLHAAFVQLSDAPRTAARTARLHELGDTFTRYLMGNDSTTYTNVRPTSYVYNVEEYNSIEQMPRPIAAKTAHSDTVVSPVFLTNHIHATKKSGKSLSSSTFIKELAAKSTPAVAIERIVEKTSSIIDNSAATKLSDGHVSDKVTSVVKKNFGEKQNIIVKHAKHSHSSSSAVEKSTSKHRSSVTKSLADQSSLIVKKSVDSPIVAKSTD